MSWENWDHAQRAEFISYLNQPDKKLDDAIKKRDRQWAEDNHDQSEERAAIQGETQTTALTAPRTFRKVP